MVYQFHTYFTYIECELEEYIYIEDTVEETKFCKSQLELNTAD